RVGRCDRAGIESQGQWRRIALVTVPAAVVLDVSHGQWPRAAVLHRAVLAAWLRELHARRCGPAIAAGNLERACLSRVSRGAAIRSAAEKLRQLRPALEPVSEVTVVSA